MGTPSQVSKRFPKWRIAARFVRKALSRKLRAVVKYLDHCFSKRTNHGQAIYLVGSYYRRLLYGGASVLTVVILAASAVSAYAFIQNYLNDQESIFFAQKEAVSAAVERVEARLRGFTMFQSTTWPLWDRHGEDFIPVPKYQRLLKENNGIVVAGDDITVKPYSIISTLTNPEDAPQLAQAIKILRDISPFPSLHMLEKGSALNSFMYDSSKRFLAIYPSFDAVTGLRKAKSPDLQTFICQESAVVEKELAKYPEEELKRGKIVWIPLHWNSFIGEAMAHFAGTIYHGDKRVAVLVFSVRPQDFPRFFLSKDRETPNFFVIARERAHFIRIQKQVPEVARYADIALQNWDLFRAADSKIKLFRVGGTLFFTQHILSPDWVAVYALDWRKLFVGLKGEFTLTLVFTLGLLTILWVFVFIFERYIFSPIQARSQRVYESEKFNSTVISTAPVGLSVIDIETGKVVIKNDIANRLLKDEPDEVDESYRKLLETYLHTVNQVGKNQPDAFYNEMSFLDIEGKRRDLAVSFAPSRYQGRDVVLCGLSDISARKEAERLLLEAKRAADNANQAKSMFLAAMGHEIRTPLHGALGNLELLDRELLQTGQKELVATIRRSFETLLVLLNDILDLSKIEAGELKIESSVFNLKSIIESCARTFSPLILKKGVHFFCLIDPHLHHRFMGDGARIQQILMNLLSNATKFTDVGKIMLKADLIDDGKGHYRVRFQVADSGVGIAKQNQAKLFSPFTQADTSITRRFGGTGLGLSLCKKLSDLMGGTISLTSEEGLGTIFVIDLPLELVSEQPLSKHLEGQSILLVCSTVLWTDLLTEMFELGGGVVSSVKHIEDIEISAYSSSTILVIAQSGGNGELIWQSTVIRHFRGPIVISPAGPYQPEFRNGAIYVSSLSNRALRKAFQLVLDEDYSQPLTVMHVQKESHEQQGVAILVAEDDPVNRRLLLSQLQALGYNNVEEAVDGKEAFEKCKKKSYDVVLTDLGMPHMDGCDLVHALRDANIQTQVIVITASTISHEGIDIKTQGVANVLHKPVLMAQLGSALKKVLRVIKEKLITQPDSSSVQQISAPEVEILVPTQSVLSLDLELKNIFVESWQTDLPALQQAFELALQSETGDTQAFQSQLHKLWGALAVLNEQKLSQLCEQLKDECRAQGISAVQTLYEEFVQQVNDTARKYQEGN